MRNIQCEGMKLLHIHPLFQVSWHVWVRGAKTMRSPLTCLTNQSWLLQPLVLGNNITREAKNKGNYKCVHLVRGRVRKLSLTRLEEHTCEASTTCFLPEGQRSHLHAHTWTQTGFGFCRRWNARRTTHKANYNTSPDASLPELPIRPQRAAASGELHLGGLFSYYSHNKVNIYISQLPIPEKGESTKEPVITITVGAAILHKHTCWNVSLNAHFQLNVRKVQSSPGKCQDISLKRGFRWQWTDVFLKNKPGILQVQNLLVFAGITVL